MEFGGGEFGRSNDGGDLVARQIERDAIVQGKGRAPLHRDRGRKRRLRRFFRRVRRRNSAYLCCCRTPPRPGDRHQLDCEFRNEGIV